jgi:hypothetical protein
MWIKTDDGVEQGKSEAILGYRCVIHVFHMQAAAKAGDIKCALMRSCCMNSIYTYLVH